MYILDEPSIGLHQRDNRRLLNTLTYLRDLGNTVIVVEHDEEAIRSADHVVDMGPGAGVHGGQVVAQGTPAEIIADPASLTGQYLSGRRRIPLPAQLHVPDPERMVALHGASRQQSQGCRRGNPRGAADLRHRGVGLGQVHADQRYPVPSSPHASSTAPAKHPRPIAGIAGLELFDKVVDIDQSPIGRTPRSNPATYTGLFAPIRELFAGTQEARARGYAPGPLQLQRAAAGAARPARATASSRWRCISCPTSTWPATYATAGATTARRWKCATRAATSMKCWR